MVRNQNDENTKLYGMLSTKDEYPMMTSNGTETVTITAVAPSGVGTATISKWLVIDVNGTLYYIPMWT